MFVQIHFYKCILFGLHVGISRYNLDHTENYISGNAFHQVPLGESWNKSSSLLRAVVVISIIKAAPIY